MDKDKTVLKVPNTSSKVPESRAGFKQLKLRVSLNTQNQTTKIYTFTNEFSVGRALDNDIVISTETASRYHLKVKLKADRWWIYDLNSANGTYLNNNLITQKSLLDFPALISLGVSNISLKIEILSPENNLIHAKPKPTTQLHSRHHSSKISKGELKKRLLAKSELEDSSDYTQMVRTIIHEARTTQSKCYKNIIWGISLLFLLLIGFIAYQQTTLSNTHDLAVDMFYNIKTLEINLSQTEIRLEENAEVLALTMQAIANKKIDINPDTIKVEQEKIAADKKRMIQARQRLQSMSAKYQEYINKIESLKFGLSSGMNYEEQLIVKVAKGFGESELELPESFISEVKRYIEYWQKSSRMAHAMKSLENNNYTTIITNALENNNLPLYFLYLPLQESNYDTRAIGPETRFGIAKGAWQFLPSTGQEFGLAPGPLANKREYDQQDERFNFTKATQAGADYLKHIYSTEAQASGLLVMAGYNYGHTRVKKMIRKMPDSPRDRNFWKFIQQYKIPKETYDYVFYVFSAAVIGEDPEYFGFSFKRPFNINTGY